MSWRYFCIYAVQVKWVQVGSSRFEPLSQNRSTLLLWRIYWMKQPTRENDRTYMYETPHGRTNVQKIYIKYEFRYKLKCSGRVQFAHSPNFAERPFVKDHVVSATSLQSSPRQTISVPVCERFSFSIACNGCTRHTHADSQSQIFLF